MIASCEGVDNVQGGEGVVGDVPPLSEVSSNFGSQVPRVMCDAHMSMKLCSLCQG